MADESDLVDELHTHQSRELYDQLDVADRLKVTLERINKALDHLPRSIGVKVTVPLEKPGQKESD